MCTHYNVEILNSFIPELQLKNTEFAKKLKSMLKKLRDFKFVIISVLIFKKSINEDETKYCVFYSNSKVETIIQDTDIDSIFESIYSTAVTKLRKYQAEGSGCTIDSVIEQNICVWKYKPLIASMYIKLSKELNHSRKRLVNVLNINQTFDYDIAGRYLFLAWFSEDF